MQSTERNLDPSKFMTSQILVNAGMIEKGIVIVWKKYSDCMKIWKREGTGTEKRSKAESIFKFSDRWGWRKKKGKAKQWQDGRMKDKDWRKEEVLVVDWIVHKEGACKIGEEGRERSAEDVRLEREKDWKGRKIEKYQRSKRERNPPTWYLSRFGIGWLWSEAALTCNSLFLTCVPTLLLSSHSPLTNFFSSFSHQVQVIIFQVTSYLILPSFLPFSLTVTHL